MPNNFDQLENQAYRQAGVMPGTKRGQIDGDKRRAIDGYIYDGVRRNPSLYSNDSRASKYLKNTTFEDREALAQRELAQSVNPGDEFKNDFMDLGDGHTMNSLDEDQPAEEEQDDSQSRNDNREPEEEQEPEPEPNEESADQDPEAEEKSPRETPEGEPGAAQPEPAGEPAMGADAAAKAPAAEEGAANLAKGLGSAGEAADGLGAATAAAGATEGAGALAAAGTGAAVEGGAAVAATSEIWLPIVAVLVAFFLVLAAFTAIAWNNPGSASATETDSGAKDAASIVKKGIEYKNNLTLYKSQMVKTVTDCWGFVATTLKYSADPNVKYSMSAADAPALYFNKHPEKYTEISPVTSTSQLKPGDLLFKTSGGSHAQLWVGKGAGGCPGGVISASLYDHPPQCSSWYPAMSKAERLK